MSRRGCHLCLGVFAGLAKVTARAVFLVAALFGAAAVGQVPAEPVLRFSADQTGVVVGVRTGGCTDKGSFKLVPTASNVGDGRTAELLLIRIVPDACKGNFPDGTEVRFTWDEIGVKASHKVKLMNPIQ